MGQGQMTIPRTSQVAEAFSSLLGGRSRWLAGTSVMAFLLSWELASRFAIVNPLWISSPTGVIEAAGETLFTSEFRHHVWISGQEFIVGLGVAIFLGIVLGIIMGWYAPADEALGPFVTLLYVTPKVALVPLFVIWFGIGVLSKMVIIFLAAIFPILVNTQAGVKSTDPTLIRVARSYNASDLQIFRSIVLPNSVPYIVSGFRLGMGRGLVAVVYGEIYAASAGVGFFIARAGQRFQTDLVFVGVAVIAIVGLALNWIAKRWEAHLIRWRPDE